MTNKEIINIIKTVKRQINNIRKEEYIMENVSIKDFIIDVKDLGANNTLKSAKAKNTYN